jgi:hypothetical protein
MLAADYVFWFAVALMAGISVYYGRRITDARVAIQWGLDGKPTSYAPKAIVLWGPLAFALAIRLMIWAAMTYTPEKVHGPDIGLLLFSIIAAASHFWVLRSAARSS